MPVETEADRKLLEQVQQIDRLTDLNDGLRELVSFTHPNEVVDMLKQLRKENLNLRAKIMAHRVHDRDNPPGNARTRDLLGKSGFTEVQHGLYAHPDEPEYHFAVVVASKDLYPPSRTECKNMLEACSHWHHSRGRWWKGDPEQWLNLRDAYTLEFGK